MNNYLRRCCTGLIFAGLLVGAQAEEFHLGFVKTDRIFNEANSAKPAQAKLEREFSKREKDIAAQDAAYVNPKHDITDKVLKIMNAQSVK